MSSREGSWDNVPSNWDPSLPSCSSCSSTPVLSPRPGKWQPLSLRPITFTLHLSKCVCAPTKPADVWRMPLSSGQSTWSSRQGQHICLCIFYRFLLCSFPVTPVWPEHEQQPCSVDQKVPERERPQWICINNTFSDCLVLNFGASQGCIISSPYIQMR